jgi:hypothetical protein
MIVRTLLRLRPFRALAFVFIDSDLFRHALEERLKREYLVRGPGESDGSGGGAPPPSD